MSSLIAQCPAPTAPSLTRQSVWPWLLFTAAGLLLAIEPARWLAESWVDPAYASSGAIVFALVLGLFAWSATSPLRPGAPPRQARIALGLLGISALARLTSQVLAINTVGAFCLVADVYALALLARLDRRERAVSPVFLALLFAFSLPLERILQRSIGYLLQEFSADGACAVLGLVYPELQCHGVRLILGRTDVLVDLPCSGARTLLLGLTGYAVAASLFRPGTAWAAFGLGVTLAAAAIANVARISVLAVGLADPASVGGIDVMAAPWHDLIGLAALSLVATAVLLWALNTRPASPRARATALPRVAPEAAHALGVMALSLAVVIVSLPRTPIDVAEPAVPRSLPLAIGGEVGRPVALTAREHAFFTQFGGWAAKAAYGEHGLMLVSTSSPLRHLHAPEDCLRGLGFEVAYLGTVYEPVPTAHYRAIAPDGRRYQVAVSFVSDRGEMVPNVATAVWRWLQGDARRWTAIQRITPEDAAPVAHAAFTDGVLAALDLSAIEGAQP